MLEFGTHFKLANFLKCLLRVATFLLVLCMDCLFLIVLSKVTPMYLGLTVFSRAPPILYSVCSRSLVVRVVDFETEVSRIQCMLEPASWHCVVAQIIYKSHVLSWTACKRTHNQYETSCGFLPHPRECIYDSGSIISLSIGSDYQYQYVIVRIRHRLWTICKSVILLPQESTTEDGIQ